MNCSVLWHATCTQIEQTHIECTVYMFQGLTAWGSAWLHETTQPVASVPSTSRTFSPKVLPFKMAASNQATDFLRCVEQCLLCHHQDKDMHLLINKYMPIKTILSLICMFICLVFAHTEFLQYCGFDMLLDFVLITSLIWYIGHCEQRMSTKLQQCYLCQFKMRQTLFNKCFVSDTDDMTAVWPWCKRLQYFVFYQTKL